MEKKWICRYGLCALAILIFIPGLFIPGFDARAEVQDVEVSVEVEIRADNVAAAMEQAQKRAFAEALHKTFPSDLSEEEKQTKLRQAANYIKSFQLLSQKEENGKLIATFRCQVITGSESLGSEAGFEERFALEIIWNGSKSSMPLTELHRMLVEEYKLRVGLMKLQKGSWWIELETAQRPESVYAHLSSRLRPKAEIRLIKDLEGIFTEQPSILDNLQKSW